MITQEYPGRDLNPYRYYYPQDFKSCVSTNSTTRAKPKKQPLSPDSYRDGEGF